MLRCLLGGVVIAVLSAMIAGAENKNRIFTSADGRSIVGKVVDSDSARGRVRIERSNGKKVWAPITAFSEPDRDYIRQWMKAAVFLSSSRLRLSADKKKEGLPGSKDTQIHYELELRNRAGIEFGKLTVDYRMFISVKQYDGGKDSTRYVHGTLIVPPIPNGKSVISKTRVETLRELFKTVYVDSREYSGGYSYTTRVPEQHRVLKDQIQGIWFKIRGPAVGGIPVVRDYWIPSDLNKKVEWN